MLVHEESEVLLCRASVLRYGRDHNACGCGESVQTYGVEKGSNHLQILADVVKASKLTESRKEAIICKLYSTIGVYRHPDPDNIVFLDAQKRVGNPSIIYNIDAIETAIKQNRQISFLYFHLDENKDKVYHCDKKRYVFNPLSMIWSRDNYYLLCYDDKHDMTTSTRAPPVTG